MMHLPTSVAPVVCVAAQLVGAANAHAAAVSLSEKLAILKQTYPSVIADIRGNDLVFASGDTLQIDDGRRKDHEAKLKGADVEDSLSQIYPVGKCAEGPPPRNFDPGRIRNDRLMRRLFGATKTEVQRSLVRIAWIRGKLRVTQRQGVDAALRKVRNDLRRLPKRFHKFFVKTGGTFNWRVIAGTKRLSVHSFGAAIDINTAFTDYWRWAGGKPGNVPKYKNKIPSEIVRIFEKHGFIWGGKWYHFDTMHFEYRPELIEIGRLAASRNCT